MSGLGSEVDLQILSTDARKIMVAGPDRVTDKEMVIMASTELHARIIQQISEALAPWGLPLDKYDVRVTQDGQVMYSRVEELPSCTVTFTHRETRAEVAVTQIYTDDKG